MSNSYTSGQPHNFIPYRKMTEPPQYPATWYKWQTFLHIAQY